MVKEKIQFIIYLNFNLSLTRVYPLVYITYGGLHMRKSVKRFYEIDRSYDYGDACGFKNTKQNVGFVKHRSHKRLRQQLKKFI